MILRILSIACALQSLKKKKEEKRSFNFETDDQRLNNQWAVQQKFRMFLSWKSKIQASTVFLFIREAHAHLAVESLPNLKKATSFLAQYDDGSKALKAIIWKKLNGRCRKSY